jgi:hypothetical protein
MIAQTAREAIAHTGSADQFVVLDESVSFGFRYGGFIVVQAPLGQMVDRFRSRSCAEYAARHLNAGGAHIRPHACLGCRVEIGEGK